MQTVVSAGFMSAAASRKRAHFEEIREFASVGRMGGRAVVGRDFYVDVMAPKKVSGWGPAAVRMTQYLWEIEIGCQQF